MKHVLFIVSQLFQYMVATHLKKIYFKDDTVDLLIMDSFSGASNLYNKAEASKEWNQVFIVSEGSPKNKVLQENLKYLMDVKNRFFDSVNRHLNFPYDAILFNNSGKIVTSLLLKAKMQHNTQIYHFEEGFGSYIEETLNADTFLTKARRVFKDILAQFCKTPKYCELTTACYYFQPNLVCFTPQYPQIQIPPFDFNDTDFVKAIQTAYGVNFDIAKEFECKYIFFEENIRDDSIDDFKLIMEIAEAVGKENIIIKPHPRRPADRFSQLGIKVSKIVGIPWEALLLSHDFSDKVLITISSSAGLASRLYFNAKIKTFMLYKLFDKLPHIPNPAAYYRYMENFEKSFGDEKFIVPSDKDSFFSTIE